MTTNLIHPAAQPPALPYSKFAYGRKPPKMRGADVRGICSVRVQDLFSDIPDPIHQAGEDISPVRSAAREALAGVDMSMIKPGDSVHVLCSEHGFGMMGGEAYAELLRTVHDEVVARTGTDRVKLALSSASSTFEQHEIIPRFGLDDYFDGRVFAFGPSEPGIAIDTEIGTLYGIRKAYAAKWLIHVHYDDPREIHFHHMNGRLLKSFTMSYARMETRSIFHNNFPTRSANIVPRAIYESPYIRERFAFSAVLSTSPSGTMGIGADNDLIALDRRITAEMLRRYGKMVQLFSTIDSCFTVADDTRWLPYQHAGGLTACTLYENAFDHLDLDLAPHPPAHPHPKKLFAGGPVKAMVLNYAWKMGGACGITVTADDAVAADFSRVHPDNDLHVASSLADAVDMAADLAGTDHGLVFDGCYGSINMTEPMARALIERAPEVSDDVDRVHLPKWLRQRGLEAVA